MGFILVAIALLLSFTSILTNGEYKLETNDNKFFTASREFIQQSTTLKNLLSDSKTDIDSVIPLNFSSEDLITTAPYIVLAKQNNLKAAAKRLNAQSLGTLLTISRVTEFLNTQQLSPLLYKALQTKLYAPRMRSFILKNPAYLIGLSKEGLNAEVQNKIVSVNLITNDITKLTKQSYIELNTLKKQVQSYIITNDSKYLICATKKLAYVFDVLDPKKPLSTFIYESKENKSDENFSAFKSFFPGTTQDYIISIDSDRQVHIWNIKNPQRIQYCSHVDKASSWLLSVPLKIHGNYLFCSDDYKAQIRVWDLTDPLHPKLHKTIKQKENCGLGCWDVAQDGNMVVMASGSSQGKLFVVNLSTNEVRKTKLWTGSNYFKASTGNFFIGDKESKASLVALNAQDLSCQTIYKVSHDSPRDCKITNFRLSNDGGYIVADVRDGSVHVLDIRNSQAALRIGQLSARAQKSLVTISNDSKYFAILEDDTTAVVYKIIVEDGKYQCKKTLSITTPDDIQNFSLSVNNNIFIVQFDNTVRICEILDCDGIERYLTLDQNFLLQHAYAAQEKKQLINLAAPENKNILTLYNSLIPNLQRQINHCFLFKDKNSWFGILKNWFVTKACMFTK